MSTYVLTERSDGDATGGPACFPEGAEVLAVIFTERRLAARFHESLPEKDRYIVTRLNAMELLRAIVRAGDAGIDYLAVDPAEPERVTTDLGLVLPVDGQLAQFAEMLTRNIVSVKESASRRDALDT